MMPGNTRKFAGPRSARELRCISACERIPRACRARRQLPRRSASLATDRLSPNARRYWTGTWLSCGGARTAIRGGEADHHRTTSTTARPSHGRIRWRLLPASTGSRRSSLCSFDGGPEDDGAASFSTALPQLRRSPRCTNMPRVRVRNFCLSHAVGSAFTTGVPSGGSPDRRADGHAARRARRRRDQPDRVRPLPMVQAGADSGGSGIASQGRRAAITHLPTPKGQARPLLHPHI